MKQPNLPRILKDCSEGDSGDVVKSKGKAWENRGG